MAYGFVQDLPIDADFYSKLLDEIGFETPEGLIAHIVTPTATGLRYIDVWETEADYERFVEARVHPALERLFAGFGAERPAELPREEFPVHDVWVR
jgi:hypothetical protein